MTFDPYRPVFDRDGFVIVPQLLGPDEFSALCANLDRSIREVVPTLPDRGAFYVDKARPETLKQMQHMGGDSYFRDYAKHPTWVALAEALLGEEAQAQEPEWFNKPPGTQSPTPPHQDNYYFNLKPPSVLTIWMALYLVAKKNASFASVPASHGGVIPRTNPTTVFAFRRGITNYGHANDV